MIDHNEFISIFVSIEMTLWPASNVRCLCNAGNLSCFSRSVWLCILYGNVTFTFEMQSAGLHLPHWTHREIRELCTALVQALYTHTHTHTHIHTRKHAHAHTHTHTSLLHFCNCACLAHLIIFTAPVTVFRMYFALFISGRLRLITSVSALRIQCHSVW
jgi:hypothetical protein